MMMSTLILNADYSPLSFVPISTIGWKDAIKIAFLGHARVVEEYSDWVVHSPSITIPVPSVMISETYIKAKQHVKFSRSNLMLRDNFTCQYCSKPLEMKELTVDHVIPRVRGGKTTWDNIVASCYVCNTIKGHKQHMKPKQKPFKPGYHHLINNAKKMHIVIPDTSWIPYLNWDTTLITVQPPNKKIINN